MAKLSSVHLLGRVVLSVLAYLAAVVGASIIVRGLLSLMGEPHPISMPGRVEFAPLYVALAALAGFAAGFASGDLWIGIIGGLVGAELVGLFITTTGDTAPLWWNGVFLLTSGPAGGMGGAYGAAREAGRLEALTMPSTWDEQIASLLAERYEVRQEWLIGVPEAQRLNALRGFAQRYRKNVVFQKGVIRPRVDYVNIPPFC